MTNTYTDIPLVAQVVRVVNESDKAFVAKYDKVPYTVPAHGQMFIPYMAMVLYCGDPNAVDVPGDKNGKYRTEEFERLCVLYGVYENADVGYDLNGVPYPDGGTRWEHDRPNLKVFNAAGDQLITVLDDREGAHLTPSTTSAAEENALLASMAAMQQQIATLQAQIAAGQSDPSVMTNGGFPASPAPEHDRTDTPLVAPEAPPMSVDDAVAEVLRAQNKTSPVLAKRSDTPPEDAPNLTPGV